MTSVPSLPTVLIVDDDRTNRTVLAEMLRDECRIVLAKDGHSALQRMREEDVSLVLLDISMPGMNGYEVLAQIKADSRTADVGVIFITGHSDEADEERGLLLGAADYVSKPIRPLIARARIHVHLALATQRRELERMSMQDGLTGIANRRRFDEGFSRLCRYATRTSEHIGLVMLDVDHFKEYNDHYGHNAGDEALRKVAKTLENYARRPQDIAARYGGEEFVLVTLAPLNFEDMLEKLRQDVLGLAIPHLRSHAADRLTISGGGLVAYLTDPSQAIDLLRHADTLLYRAKHAGRNKILIENSRLHQG